MRSRTPAGFYLLSICAAAFGVCAALVAGLTENEGRPGETILVRALAALLACLSAVAAEALWRARPWAYRASLALAVAYAAAVTLLCLGTDGLDGLMTAFWILLFSAWVVVPIVVYVRGHSTRLFGTPRPPSPVPRPVAPGGRRPQPWW